MKRLIISVLLFFLSTPAIGGQVKALLLDGNAFYRALLNCDRHGWNIYQESLILPSGTETQDYVNCIQAQYYIWGVQDAEEYFYIGHWCIPDEVNGYQLFDVVLKWIRENPSDRHSAPIAMIESAFRAAWLCPEE